VGLEEEVQRVPKISFVMEPVPPFSLELTVWTLRRRPDNEIDRWDGRVYSRIFLLDSTPVRVSVSQEGGRDQPRLQVTVAAEVTDPRVFQTEIAAILEWVFGLGKDFTDFYSLPDRDGRLRPLLEQFVGTRPPRFPTLFEALVNAIACQQLTLHLGIILLNRLARGHGMACKKGETVLHAFPRPEDLAALAPEDLRLLGFSRNKGLAIVSLAEGIVSGKIELEGLKELNDSEGVRSLSRLRGVGRWSAEYVLLRGLGRTNVFPGDDVGAQKSLQQFLGLDHKLDYQQIRRITSSWQPYAGLIYFHFLLSKLKKQGYLS
jgi:DNA-3-methyladenine glycosylase II